jgi:hypothetical protein
MATEVIQLRESLDWLKGDVANRAEAYERLERAHADVVGSPSWRITQPLRAAKRRALAVRRRRAPR